MPVVLPCPDPDLLRRLFRGEVADEQVDSLAGHLDHCPACADAIRQLPAPDTLAEKMHATAIESLPAELRRVMDRLRRPVAKNDDTVSPDMGAPGELGFLAAPQAEDEIGRLAHYRVLKLLGKGGMGAVYLAHDPQLDRQVALKVMLPAAASKPAARERFLREARLAARIEHDHIVPIHQVGQHEGLPYLAMPVLKGCSLGDLLQQRGQLSFAQVVRLVRQIAAGLAAAHEQGLVHRDIKPANLWIDPSQGGRIKFLDFGLARLEKDDTGLTQSGIILGTPAYMSPEQARGEKIDARTDLWSLGVILFEMTTGVRPFTAPTTMGILTSIALDQPVMPTDVHPALANLTMRLLEKDPSMELHNPFAGLNQPSQTDSLAAPVAATTPRKQPPRRRVLVAVAAAFLFLIAGGFLAQQIIIRITDKDGKTRDVEVKPGEKIEIVQTLPKDKATNKPKDKVSDLPKAKPIDPQPAQTGDPDRGAAEYAFSVGGHVQINGNEKTLTGAHELPKETFQLTSAYLHNNSVIDEGLAIFKDCKNLTDLRLGSSLVTDAGLANFKNCKNLTTLDLNWTQVTGAGLANFKDCKNLTDLNLYAMRTTDAGLAHLKDCKNLRKLSLVSTGVTNAGLAHLKDCKNLTTLHLGGTGVTDAGLAHLKDCKNLSLLDLSSTQVSDAGLANFNGCKNLAILTLFRTRVTDAGLANFKDCKNLSSLDLGSTGVTDAGLAHLKDCKNLSELTLGNTRVTGAGLTNFKDCKNLKNFSLSQIRVGDADLEILAGFPEIRSMNLAMSRVSKNGYEQLKAAVPDCAITWSEQNRFATEQVLALGGTVQIAAPGKEARTLKLGEPLPGEFFQLRQVSLRDIQKPLGELPAFLTLLRFAEFDRLEAIDLTGLSLPDLQFLLKFCKSWTGLEKMGEFGRN